MPGGQTQKSKSTPRLMTIKQVAEYVNVSRGKVDGWIKRGLLPFYDLPGSGNGEYHFRRVAEEDLMAFLQRYYSNQQEETFNRKKATSRAQKSGAIKLLSRDEIVEM